MPKMILQLKKKLERTDCPTVRFIAGEVNLVSDENGNPGFSFNLQLPGLANPTLHYLDRRDAGLVAVLSESDDISSLEENPDFLLTAVIETPEPVDA